MGKIELDHTGSGGGITLSSDGTSLLLGGTAIGGLDLYAENPSSPTAPSATGTNAVAIGDGASATNNYSLAIGGTASASNSTAVAIGYGATASSGFSLALGREASATDGGAAALGYNAVSAGSGGNATALTNSYASGANSFAAAIGNNTSSYGATGANSVAMGYQAKATASGARAIGQYNTANATFSAAIGGAGNVTQNTASYSFVSGQYAKSTIVGQKVHASGQFAATGDAQGSMFILRADTTDATATVLTTNNGTGSTNNQIVAASDTCIMFSGTLVAMQNGAQDQGGWEIKGLLKNDGGTTTLVNSEVKTFADGNGWTVVLSADNTNNALAITCTGEAAHNIRWVANISTSEVTYA